MTGAGSITQQRYLKAAWYVAEAESVVTVGHVAQRLEVSHASASSGLKGLADQQLLQEAEDRGFRLTAEGQRGALRLVRRHRLIETFLAEVLDVPWDQVHDETERFEWFISDDLELRIAEVLGNPERDPHGDPIPTAEGQHEEDLDLPLAQVPLGATARLVRIRDDDPALLRFLDDVGLGIGSLIRVDRRDPFGGPLWLSSDQGQHALGQPAVRAISVSEVAEHEATP